MPWLSDALQGVRSRGSGLKDLLSESAREIAARTQQLEEAVTHSVANYLQSAPTARELEARLEADAKRLARPGTAAEVVQKWLVLIRGGAQVRYPDDQRAPQGQLLASTLNSASSSSDAASEEASASPPGSSAPAVPAELTFHQVFLRSRALEFALDAATRAPELRAALRERALPPPEAWPEEQPPPVIFARAFVALLHVTLGPSEGWLPFLGALLSSDKGPVDDQCHAWLVQLLVGGRASWTEVALADRRVEVESAEEAAASSVAGLEPEPTVDAPSSLRLLLAGLQRRGKAAEAGYRAWSMRSGLDAELAQTAVHHKDAAKERASFASTIALVASERAKELDETAHKQRSASEQEQDTLRKQESALREKLGSLQPSLEQTERELEQAELTHRELLEQVQRVASRIEALRQRKAEQARQEESLLSELGRTEGSFTKALLAEEEAHGKTSGARALAETVAELASGLAATADSTGSPKAAGLPAAGRGSSSERSIPLPARSVRALAESELGRLRLMARTAGVCAEVAEERRRSRQAMVELGVPTSTLESDVVGEAEISQAVSSTMEEIDRCRTELDSLCEQLSEEAGARPAPAAAAAAERGTEEQIASGGAAASSSEGSPAAAAAAPPAGEGPAAVDAEAATGGAGAGVAAASPGGGTSEASRLAAALRAELAECTRARGRLAALVPEAPAGPSASSSGAASGSGGGAGAEKPLPKGDPFLLFM